MMVNQMYVLIVFSSFLGGHGIDCISGNVSTIKTEAIICLFPIVFLPSLGKHFIRHSSAPSSVTGFYVSEKKNAVRMCWFQ